MWLLLLISLAEKCELWQYFRNFNQLEFSLGLLTQFQLKHVAKVNKKHLKS